MDSSFDRTPREIMYQHLWRFLPFWMMDLYEKVLPARSSKRFRRFVDKGSRIGYNLLAEQTKFGTSVDQTSKDVLSVLSECMDISLYSVGKGNTASSGQSSGGPSTEVERQGGSCSSNVSYFTFCCLSKVG
jgi:hypothetical protein